MSASDFPLLSTLPEYPLTEQKEKVGITTRSEYGYIHGRKRFTMSRMTYGVSYPLLSGYDKSLLEAHVEEADIAETFYWEHPWTRVTYIARYNDIPKFELVIGNYWKTSFEVTTFGYAEDTWGDGDYWGDAMSPPIDIWGIT